MIPSPSQSTLELGPLTIHFYALCIIVGIALAIFIGNKRFVARGGQTGLVGDIAIYAVPAGIIGGRLYHVLTSPDKYLSDPVSALFIWEGGLGIWGAISLGAVVAFLAFRKHSKRGEINFSVFADALAPGLLVAQAVGRFGNWFNKELFGRPLDAPWALQIPEKYRPLGFSNFETFHPTFLYESLWCFFLAILLIKVHKLNDLKSGSIFALYVAGYSLGRGVIETFRIDDANLIFGLRLNVWTSALLFSSAVVYLLKRNRQHNKSTKTANI